MSIGTTGRECEFVAFVGSLVRALNFSNTARLATLHLENEIQTAFTSNVSYYESTEALNRKQLRRF